MGATEPRLRLGCFRGALRLTRICTLGAGLLFVSAIACAQTATPLAEADIIGLTRADVVRSLGKPQSTARRGEKEILIYANGARVELLGDEVISFQGSPTAVIIDEDGTRYIPGADGKVRRADGQIIARVRTNEKPVAAEPTAEGVSTEALPDSQAGAGDLPASPSPGDAAAATKPVADEQVFSTVPNLDQKIPGSKTTVEKYLETGQIVPEEQKKPPAWVGWVGEAIGMALRFGFVVLVLSLAIRWVGLPFYWPDLMKVSALYVAVREAMHGLGGFGGLWEFIRIFKIADGVSYLALMFFLWKFRVVIKGITALKIATATALVTYFLMMILMLALTFVLMALR
jgi:hypothetical protein